MQRIRKPARPTRDCSIPGCPRRTRSRFSPFCDAHYQQRLRHGDPLVNKQHQPDLALVAQRQPIASARYSIDPDSWTGSYPSNHGGWKGDRITYNGAHARVVRLRGPASHYACEECGQQAGDWAYDHRDPEEKIAQDGPYSPDPVHYFPLCTSCHVQLDTLQKISNETCRHGHRWDEQVPCIDPKGRRHCRICAREAGRRSYRKRRAAESA